MSDQLFGLYVDVLETLAEWKHVRMASRTVAHLRLSFGLLLHLGSLFLASVGAFPSSLLSGSAQQFSFAGFPLCSLSTSSILLSSALEWRRFALPLTCLSRVDQNKIIDPKQVPWSDVVSNIANMTDKMDQFAARCKKLPGRLKQWDAFTQLRSERAP